MGANIKSLNKRMVIRIAEIDAGHCVLHLHDGLTCSLAGFDCAATGACYLRRRILANPMIVPAAPRGPIIVIRKRTMQKNTGYRRGQGSRQ
jgi:hypothetical protein